MMSRSFRSLKPFRRLQWRLAFSYAVVTVVVVLAIQLAGIFLAGLAFFAFSLFPQAIAQRALVIGPQFTRLLAQTPPNTEALTIRLQQLKEELETPGKGSARGFGFGMSSSREQSVALVVTDANGVILACVPEGIYRISVPIHASLSELELGVFNSAKRGVTDVERISARAVDSTMTTAIPIFGDGENKSKVIGVFFVKIRAPFVLSDFIKNVVGGILPTTIVVAVFSGFSGMIFGFWTARRLTQRIRNISDAAENWSQGQFMVSAPVTPDDELGQLGNRLNQMARELQDFLSLRQALAKSDERNRLARELHDTVKQNVFAAAMQIAAARKLMPPEATKADARLAEAEKITQQVRRELTEILLELRPSESRNVGLAVTLREYLDEWIKRTGIAASVECENIPLAPVVASAMLRVAQEALANIARHSDTRLVSVSLRRLGADRVVLTIEDNGRGFDIDRTTSGMGLRNMRERSEALPDGKFEIESSHEHGTRVQVSCFAGTNPKESQGQ